MADAPRLDDAVIEQRLARLDELLGRLEIVPGATAALAIEAIQALTEVYGEALARAVDRAAGTERVLAAFEKDELLRHLMVLHGLHPQPLAERVERALDGVRPYLRSHGGDVELVGVADGVARVALVGHCDGCASSTATMEAADSTAVLDLAPELDRVEALPATAPAHPAPVIAVDSLLRRPVPS
jgi:Fe-S cluster biogenesis protein NfuA